MPQDDRAVTGGEVGLLGKRKERRCCVSAARVDIRAAGFIICPYRFARSFLYRTNTSIKRRLASAGCTVSQSENIIIFSHCLVKEFAA